MKIRVGYTANDPIEPAVSGDSSWFDNDAAVICATIGTIPDEFPPPAPIIAGVIPQQLNSVGILKSSYRLGAQSGHRCNNYHGGYSFFCV